MFEVNPWGDSAWLSVAGALGLFVGVCTAPRGWPRFIPPRTRAPLRHRLGAALGGGAHASTLWLLWLPLAALCQVDATGWAAAGSAGGWLDSYLLLLLGFAACIQLMAAAHVSARAPEFTAGCALLCAALGLLLSAEDFFSLVLILELQGLLVFYLMGLSVEAPRRGTKIAGGDGAWFYAALTAQFWPAFVGSLALLYAGAAAAAAAGSSTWEDWGFWHEFAVELPGLGWVPRAALLTLLLAAALLLKIGAAPVHLWKPELYRHLGWEFLVWYGVVYTFALLTLITCLLQLYLGVWPTAPLLWLSAAAALVVLPNILFLVGELKLFMAYMAVFHSTFVLLGGGHPAYAYAYALLYGLMSLHFGSLLFSLRRRSLQYTTDLQLVAATGLGGAATCVVASMCGIPPFLGFWAKLSVVCSLTASGQWPLALAALACGLVLMYYYIQNYRFSAGLVRATFIDRGPAAAASAALGLALGVWLNAAAIFLINDVWTLAAFGWADACAGRW